MDDEMISDETAERLVADSHMDCIVCGLDGCAGCPMVWCGLHRLVEHRGEWMCIECVPEFDRWS